MPEWSLLLDLACQRAKMNEIPAALSLFLEHAAHIFGNNLLISTCGLRDRNYKCNMKCERLDFVKLIPFRDSAPNLSYSERRLFLVHLYMMQIHYINTGELLFLRQIHDASLCARRERNFQESVAISEIVTIQMPKVRKVLRLST